MLNCRNHCFKSAISFPYFAPVTLALMHKQQNFIPATQDHSSSTNLVDVAKPQSVTATDSTSQLQLQGGGV